MAYRAADDVLVDDQAVVGVVRAGDEAVADPTVRAAFDSCPAPPIAVPVGNSFSRDTLVALADGTRVPIAEVQQSHEVLAFDFGTGASVARSVTATLPHEVWLLEAHFSDGSTLSVTEDHRFWSITDTAWVELQDLDPTDILLTPDGATVTVDHLDWDAGVAAPAWDLTVDQVHNFFVAADDSAEPLLVHNQDEVAFFCGVTVDVSLAAQLAQVGERLTGPEQVRFAVAADLLDEAETAQLLSIIVDQGTDLESADIVRSAGLNAFAAREAVRGDLAGNVGFAEGHDAAHVHVRAGPRSPRQH